MNILFKSFSLFSGYHSSHFSEEHELNPNTVFPHPKPLREIQEGESHLPKLGKRKFMIIQIYSIRFGWKPRRKRFPINMPINIKPPKRSMGSFQKIEECNIFYKENLWQNQIFRKGFSPKLYNFENFVLKYNFFIRKGFSHTSLKNSFFCKITKTKGNIKFYCVYLKFQGSK